MKIFNPCERLLERASLAYRDPRWLAELASVDRYTSPMEFSMNEVGSPVAATSRTLAPLG